MKSDKNHADGLGLIPVPIIALGAPSQPVERLMTLQSAIARGVGWLAGLRRPRFRLAPSATPLQQGDRP